jgi:hypothetical protein
MGGLFDGIGDVLGGVGDAVGGVVQGIADNPGLALTAATLPFGGIGGLAGLGDAGAMGGLGNFGLDTALGGAEFGADSIAGLGAAGGLDSAMIDPSWFDPGVWSETLPEASANGTLSALGSASGGGGGLMDILQNGISKAGQKMSTMSLGDLLKLGGLGAGAIAGLSGHNGMPKFTPWTMPQAPGFLTASRSFDPSTKQFGQVQYAPRGYAAGGLASIGGGRRPKYVSPHDKAVSALRSRYRSRKQAEADAGIPGTVANQVLQGPGDPVLDDAFAYASPQQQNFAGGGLAVGPGDGMSDDIPAVIDGQHPAAIATDEYIVPADVVSHIGNGSSSAGGKALDSMVSRIRQARTGRSKQAPRINPNQFLK